MFNNKWYPPAEPTADFSDQTFIVTGSSSGLGYEAALKLATQGAGRIILACRNVPKGVRAQRVIKHLARDDNCLVDVWPLDMLSFTSVQEFAARANAKLEKLNGAILNAGVYPAKFELGPNGWETALQTNTLSTVLLALLLLPKLQASKTATHTPVLELVSSGLHGRVQLSDAQKSRDMNLLEEFNRPENFVYGRQYSVSKLFLMYALTAISSLARPKVDQPPDVYVTSVCPGACQSELSRDFNSLLAQYTKIMVGYLFLRTAEEGSRTFISGLMLGEEGHGRFWQNDEIKP